MTELREAGRIRFATVTVTVLGAVALALIAASIRWYFSPVIIRGNVTFDGKPVSGALILISNPPAGETGVPEPTEPSESRLAFALCGLHPDQPATIRSVPHGFFAVTDENSDFELPPTPSGEYSLIVRYPGAETKTVSVKIGRDSDNTVQIDLENKIIERRIRK